MKLLIEVEGNQDHMEEVLETPGEKRVDILYDYNEDEGWSFYRPKLLSIKVLEEPQEDEEFYTGSYIEK